MNLRIASGAILVGTILLLHAGGTFADEQAANKTSMFNEQWLDTVVSIEQLQSKYNLDGSVAQESDGSTKLLPSPIGTGFIVETKNKHLVLITAKHVVTDSANAKSQAKKNLVYRINQQQGPAYLLKDAQLQQSGRGEWFFSATHDVACRFLEWELTSKFRVIAQDKFMQNTQLQTAANLLVLGFPLGLRSEEHPNPIVRKGMVARAAKDEFLIDAFVFPGNSGGPVLYEPPIKIKGGGLITSPFINEEYLVGLVSSFIPYPEIAVSQQTKRPRVVFEENSGLANIVPVDAIRDLLNRDDVGKWDSLEESK